MSTFASYGSTNNSTSNDSLDSWELPDPVEETKHHSKRKIYFIVTLISAFIFGSLAIFSYSSPSTSLYFLNFEYDTQTTSVTSASTAATIVADAGGPLSTTDSVSTGTAPITTSNELTFTLSRNGYDPLIYFTPLDLSYINYKILEDYVAVIEPYSDMTLEIFGSADDKYYAFTVCELNNMNNCAEGTMYTISTKTSVPVNVGCEPYEKFYVSVEERSSSNDAVLRSAEGYALCMYVRREIRTLNDDDLDSLMDAMYSMWTTNEMIGQQTYGANFHSSTFLLEFHFFNAAWQDSDHIHEGNGFLTQHIKLTNIFESSMQAVDPSVSLPYWDFTIESTQNVSVMLSPLFTSSMFGSMPRSIDQYWGWTYRNDSIEAAAIQDGRWAFIKADKNDRYDDLNFGYGYLRAPWNMNPSPYLSRFTSNNKHLPSCSAHYTLLTYTVLEDFLYNSPYAAHAATHGTIGGVYGCDAMDEMLEKGFLLDEDGQINLCKNWIFYLKEFYRLNYIVPQTNCNFTETNHDVSELSCGYVCNPDETQNFVFELKNILNSDNDCVPYDLQDLGWMAWKDFICVGNGFKIFGGDHLEAASPADPSFWPIHPTLERLLQAKLMAGGFDDSTWPSDSASEYVCDKAECFDETLGYGYWDTCCQGHYEYDQLLDAAEGNRDAGYGQTNHEVMVGTDPSSSNYSMPYIYVDFDWAHCNLVGLDFTALLEEQYSSRQSSRYSGSEPSPSVATTSKPSIASPYSRFSSTSTSTKSQPTSSPVSTISSSSVSSQSTVSTSSSPSLLSKLSSSTLRSSVHPQEKDLGDSSTVDSNKKSKNNKTNRRRLPQKQR